MDLQLRQLERQAHAGDPDAEMRWIRLCGRRGLYFKDYQPDEVLTEWEEVQADYDSIIWHAKGPKYFFYNFCSC